MAVQRAIKLLYKYALIKDVPLYCSKSGANVVSIVGNVPDDGYGNIFGKTKLEVQLGEDFSKVVESPELQDQMMWSFHSILQQSYPATANGNALAGLGSTLGLSRMQGESDASLRARIQATYGAPQSTLYSRYGSNISSLIGDGYGC